MPPLPKNDKPIDITQIAQALGVSKTTVSRAISGNGRISAATRQRVPQDIRLASLYDNENLVNTVPPISAVQFNADILGLKATQQLLCALQGQPVETRMELGYQVSLRESTQT